MIDRDKVYTPPGADIFRSYLDPRTRPPLDPCALSLDLLVGDERDCFRRALPTNGDWSLLLSYKGKDAYVASFKEEPRDDLLTLEVTQLQGGNRGYRVMTAMDVLGFMVDQIKCIVEHPKSPYDLIVMPRVIFIVGVLDATEAAIHRYEAAARRLGMEYSDEKEMFVKSLRQTKPR